VPRIPSAQAAQARSSRSHLRYRDRERCSASGRGTTHLSLLTQPHSLPLSEIVSGRRSRTGATAHRVPTAHTAVCALWDFSAVTVAVTCQPLQLNIACSIVCMPYLGWFPSCRRIRVLATHAHSKLCMPGNPGPRHVLMRHTCAVYRYAAVRLLPRLACRLLTYFILELCTRVRESLTQRGYGEIVFLDSHTIPTT
jgi:hypothetical protein